MASSNRKRLESFTEAELNDLLHAPATHGLRTVLTGFRGASPAQSPGIEPDRSQTVETGSSKIGPPKTEDPVAGTPEKAAPVIADLEISRPAPGEPKTGTLETGFPDIGAPVAAVPETGPGPTEAGDPEAGDPVSLSAAMPTANAQEPAQAITKASKRGSPISGSLKTGEPVTGHPAPAFDLAYYRVQRQRVPRPWVSVQDAMTFGEDRVYRAIYTHGRPYGPTGADRAVLTGVRLLSQWAGISVSNVHAALRTLIQKQCIARLEANSHNDGRLLVAYSYAEIKRRWRAQGLTHVLKQSRGVSLKAETGSPILGSPVLETGDPAAGDPVCETGDPVLGETGPPDTGPLIRNKNIQEKTTSSTSSATASVSAVLREELGVVDNDAVERIIAGCRSEAPDATNEEIAALCRDAARRFRALKGVDNPVGMLIRQLPRSFQGPAFAEYRAAQHQIREAEKRKKEAERAEWQRILDDPSESEKMKHIARGALGLNSQ